MKIESSVTSISWIPSEAVEGLSRVGFDLGPAHYDNPPPDVLHDLEELRKADAFRFANELRAWVEVEDGRIKDYGQSGQGYIGATTLRLGSREVTIPAVQLPDIRPEPQADEEKVTFRQTAGGRTGLPFPRPVRRRPFFQISSPLAWTTLALTIHADGRSEHQVKGHSPFPRHWIYDHSGKLAEKSGLIDFKQWAREAFGKRTPWGDRDSPAVVTAAETALERELSRTIMRGEAEPEKRKVPKGSNLVEQGDKGEEIFLLLDGVLAAEVDGKAVAEIGPGAILGERAILEGGRRTSTLRAVTDCRVAVVPGDQIDRAALAEVARGHRREEK
jgi:hypothetical protein